jgi:hypothetical protein
MGFGSRFAWGGSFNAFHAGWSGLIDPKTAKKYRLRLVAKHDAAF